MSSRFQPRDRGGRPREILFPILPHRLADRVEEALGDTTMRGFVRDTTLLKDTARPAALADHFGLAPGPAEPGVPTGPGTPGQPDRIADLRRLAARVKRHALSTLDQQLERFEANAGAHGMIVHYAETAAEANDLVSDIARRIGAKTVVKAKSMVTEELMLLDRLLADGLEVWETDLGELVLQLDDDAPSHLVTPMIHKDRVAAARALSKLSDTPLPPDPTVLTRAARAHLRARFAAADLGITGANFLVAETGEVVTCTNEGNGRLSAMSPKVHIAIAGIEKVVASLSDLSLLLELLAKSSTGQPLTVYTSFVRGPRPATAPHRDGPDEVHVILLDAGRTRVLAEPGFRDALGCIRCGACLNTCPVYRTVGGHAYGSVWPGPIGKVLTPLLRGEDAHPDLAWASTLCGACRESCPIDIDLPGMLVALRARAHTFGITSRRLRVALAVTRFMMGGRLRWKAALGLSGLAVRLGLGPAGQFARAGRKLPPVEKAPPRARWKRRLAKRRGP